MTSHLLLPWAWEECADGEKCIKIVHFDETVDELKDYPKEWVLQLLGGNCRISENAISFINSAGRLHREDGPAVEHSDGGVNWYVNGQLHRVDGPANIRPHGYQQWYNRDYVHRDGGPAVIYADGSQEWWKNGTLHRLDGPAKEYADGRKEWWLYDFRHRDDGPAVETSWEQKWYQNNELHRVDGPAVIRDDGYREWRQNGKLHRTDGPALIEANGKASYWLDNEKRTIFAMRIKLTVKPEKRLTTENEEQNVKRFEKQVTVQNNSLRVRFLYLVGQLRKNFMSIFSKKVSQ